MYRYTSAFTYCGGRLIGRLSFHPGGAFCLACCWHPLELATVSGCPAVRGRAVCPSLLSVRCAAVSVHPGRQGIPAGAVNRSILFMPLYCIYNTYIAPKKTPQKKIKKVLEKVLTNQKSCDIVWSQPKQSTSQMETTDKTDPQKNLKNILEKGLTNQKGCANIKAQTNKTEQQNTWR